MQGLVDVGAGCRAAREQTRIDIVGIDADVLIVNADPLGGRDG